MHTYIHSCLDAHIAALKLQPQAIKKWIKTIQTSLKSMGTWVNTKNVANTIQICDFSFPILR